MSNTDLIVNKNTQETWKDVHPAPKVANHTNIHSGELRRAAVQWDPAWNLDHRSRPLRADQFLGKRTWGSWGSGNSLNFSIQHPFARLLGTPGYTSLSVSDPGKRPRNTEIHAHCGVWRSPGGQMGCQQPPYGSLCMAACNEGGWEGLTGLGRVGGLWSLSAFLALWELVTYFVFPTSDLNGIDI